jgi:hypothetical protein
MARGRKLSGWPRMGIKNVSKLDPAGCVELLLKTDIHLLFWVADMAAPMNLRSGGGLIPY